MGGGRWGYPRGGATAATSLHQIRRRKRTDVCSWCQHGRFSKPLPGSPRPRHVNSMPDPSLPKRWWPPGYGIVLQRSEVVPGKILAATKRKGWLQYLRCRRVTNPPWLVYGIMAVKFAARFHAKAYASTELCGWYRDGRGTSTFSCAKNLGEKTKKRKTNKRRYFQSQYAIVRRNVFKSKK